MADDIIKSQNTEGPFLQFDECDKKDCTFYSEDGTCSFETCIFDNEYPKTKSSWQTRCSVCNNIYVRNPRIEKIRMCDRCINKMHEAEVLPFSCIFCGSSQSRPSKIFLSQICDECFAKMKRAIDCNHAH